MNTVPAMLTGATSEKSLLGEPLIRELSPPSLPSTIPTIWLDVAVGFDAVPGKPVLAPTATMVPCRVALFNEPAGQEYLAAQGVSPDLIARLPELGISSISNMLSAVKMAKYYEMGPNDVVMTIATDSMEMYNSRIDEYRELEGEFTPLTAAGVYHRYLMGESTDNLLELSYNDRKRIHNLKYYTWVEQQGRTYEELMAQWYDPEYWTSIHGMDQQIDKLIEEFNERVESLN